MLIIQNNNRLWLASSLLGAPLRLLQRGGALADDVTQRGEEGALAAGMAKDIAGQDAGAACKGLSESLKDILTYHIYYMLYYIYSIRYILYYLTC